MPCKMHQRQIPWRLRLRRIRQVNNFKISQLNKSSLIIGRQPLIEAIQAGRAIDKILFQKNIGGESIGQIRQLAKENNIPIQ